MGEAAGHLIKILSSETDSRIILIAIVIFLVMMIVMICMIGFGFKLIRSIKENSKEEFGKENEFSVLRQQVNSTKEEIREITSLIVRLSESINASNDRTEDSLRKIRNSLASNNGGCELGKRLDKDLENLRTSILSDIRSDITLLMESDKENIKSFITNEYHYWMAEQEIDIYSLAAIKERFDKYTKEKGNTFVAGMVHELELLPRKCSTQNCQTEHMKRERDEVRIIPHEKHEEYEEENGNRN